MTRLKNGWSGLRRTVLLLPLLGVCGLGSAGETQKADLFSGPGMKQVQLQGLTVRLGQPVQVSAQQPWREEPDGPWAFIHPVPTIARFPSGELMVAYSLVADTNQNPTYVSAFQISTDGGRSWGHRYDVIPDHQPWIYLPEPDGALLAIPAHLHQDDPEDFRNFHAPFTRFERGGRRLVMEPGGLRVVDCPWAVEMFPGRAPRSNWIARLKFDGSALRAGNRILATGYLSKVGELMRNLLLSSEDGGRTWRYHATIADSSSMPESVRGLGLGHPELGGAEGPSETAMIRLADGDLMAVFRVGSGRSWNLRRAYSSDDGRSWTPAEPIPPYSVEPSMLRIANGTIVLSTGRPGIRLWLSADPRGESWQDVDIVDHHNAWAPDATYAISSYGEGRWQTSSYTEIVEVSPNRLFLVYDRGAKPVPAHPGDLTRIFVLPIEVLR